MIANCADLNIHPALLDKARRKNRWTPPDELETSLIVAWLNQNGENCPSCGREMTKHGKPNEAPILQYIVPLNDNGTKNLDNLRVVCGGCSKIED
jgi:hypothetical protein